MSLLLDDESDPATEDEALAATRGAASTVVAELLIWRSLRSCAMQTNSQRSKIATAVTCTGQVVVAASATQIWLTRQRRQPRHARGMLTWKAEADTASQATTTTVNANDLCRTAETFKGKSNGYNMQPIRAAKSRNSEGCTHHTAGWAKKQWCEKSAAVSFVERPETAAINKASKYPQTTLCVSKLHPRVSADMTSAHMLVQAPSCASLM